MTDTHRDDQLRYSLWLCPEPGSSTPLETVIDQLAAKYSSLPFFPHMTVCSRLTGDIVELTSKIAGFAEYNEPLYLCGTKFSYRSMFYQSLFIELTLDSCLQEFRHNALDVFEYTPTFEFFPHISLAYIDPQSFDAQAEISQLTKRLLLKTRYDRLTLMETSQEQKDWKKIREFKLNDR